MAIEKTKGTFLEKKAHFEKKGYNKLRWGKFEGTFF